VEFERQAMDALFAIEKRGLPARDVEYRKLEQEVIENLERLEKRVAELAMEADPLVYGKELAGDKWGKGGHFIERSEDGTVSYRGRRRPAGGLQPQLDRADPRVPQGARRGHDVHVREGRQGQRRQGEPAGRR
jgi:hypothetical protein